MSGSGAKELRAVVPAWAGLAAGSVALLGMVAYQLTELPDDLLRVHPEWAAAIAGDAVLGSLRHSWPVLAYFAGLGFVLSRADWSLRLRRALGSLLGVAAVAHAFVILALLYRRFSEAPVYGVAALFLCLAAVLVTPPPEGWKGAWMRRLYAAWPPIAGLGGVLAFVVISWFNHRSFANLFPGFHWSLLEIAALSLGMGVFSLIATWPRVAESSAGWRAASVLLLLGLAPLALRGSAGDQASAYFRGHCVHGRAAAAFDHYDIGARESPKSEALVLEEAEALAIFAQHSGLPVLPADLRLADHDLLVVTIETTRFDEARIGQEDSPMPNLSVLAGESLRFDRAYSPSSGTFQSSAGLMAMDLPSALPLTTWSRSWHGTFGDGVPTAAEWFARMNYRSFWDWVRLVDTGRREPEADARLAEAAVEFSSAVSREGRYFGWVFFVSPHEHYLVHDEKAPAATARDRYRQELRFADAQLGKLLESLRESGRFDDTIIIVTADHGEEFGDHGSWLHGSAVFEESIHVPLVVHVPGLDPAVVTHPTSTAYLLPWLFERAPALVRERAVEGVRQGFAPMMKATDGAVIVEMIGHYRMQTALIWESDKLVYDFVADLTTGYALGEDPREFKDLAIHDDTHLDTRRPALEAYREQRASRRQFAFDPGRTPDRSRENWAAAKARINKGPRD
jgi:arylsulfatase A-like enzyme